MRFFIAVIISLFYAGTGLSGQVIVISGALRGLEDSIQITLMKEEGNVGVSVAKSNVVNGFFRIEYRPDNGMVERYSLMCDGVGVPAMSLSLWVAAGATVHIEGDDKMIYTWSVNSTVPEQNEWNFFINANKKLWHELQQLSLLNAELDDELYDEETAINQRRLLSGRADSIKLYMHKLKYDIRKNELRLLEKREMSTVALEVLRNIANVSKDDKTFIPAVEKLYNNLSVDMKSHPLGQEIALVIYPLKTIKEGDYMYDTPLRDLSNKTYHLADFKGKYILLDFWSFGCAPCHASIPEMKMLHEKLKDSIIIVGLSGDNRKIWERASRVFKIPWYNLSDNQENRGIYAHYGVDGFPNYVLIAPDGIVKAIWTGYSKGALTRIVTDLTGWVLPEDNNDN